MGIFDFLNSKSENIPVIPISWEQQRSRSDDLLDAICNFALASKNLEHHHTKISDEDLFSSEYYNRGDDIATVVDSARRRVHEIFNIYIQKKIEPLPYRCMMHAANLFNTILVNDFEAWAGMIKRDMQQLKKTQPKNYLNMHALYMESFIAGVAQRKNGGWVVPDYALPLRPELMFD